MQQTPKLEMKSFSKNYRRFFRENRLQWSDNKNVKKIKPKVRASQLVVSVYVICD